MLNTDLNMDLNTDLNMDLNTDLNMDLNTLWRPCLRFSIVSKARASRWLLLDYTAFTLSLSGLLFTWLQLLFSILSIIY